MNVQADFVEVDKSEKWLGNRMGYVGDLVDTADEIVRHDPEKLTSLIKSIIFYDNLDTNSYLTFKGQLI